MEWFYCIQHTYTTMATRLQCICREVTGQMSSSGCVSVKSTGRPSPLDGRRKDSMQITQSGKMRVSHIYVIRTT